MCWRPVHRRKEPPSPATRRSKCECPDAGLHQARRFTQAWILTGQSKRAQYWRSGAAAPPRGHTRPAARGLPNSMGTPVNTVDRCICHASATWHGDASSCTKAAKSDSTYKKSTLHKVTLITFKAILIPRIARPLGQGQRVDFFCAVWESEAPLWWRCHGELAPERRADRRDASVRYCSQRIYCEQQQPGVPAALHTDTPSHRANVPASINRITSALRTYFEWRKAPERVPAPQMRPRAPHF